MHVASHWIRQGWFEMSQIPETGPNFNISSTTVFHPRQPRKGAQSPMFVTFCTRSVHVFLEYPSDLWDVLVVCFYINTWYLAFLSWASLHPSSHGTVSSIFLASSDQMTMSGLREVWTTWWKCNFLPRSTLISHAGAVCKKLFLIFMEDDGFSPSLMNWMDGVGLGWGWCFVRLSCSKMSASALRTLSWHQRYLPWLRAVLHPASICANVPLPPHNL